MTNRWNEYNYEIKNDAKMALKTLRECRKRTQTEYNKKVKFQYTVWHSVFCRASHTMNLTYSQVWEMLQDLDYRFDVMRNEKTDDGKKVYNNRGTYYKIHISTFMDRVSYRIETYYDKIKRSEEE